MVREAQQARMEFGPEDELLGRVDAILEEMQAMNELMDDIFGHTSFPYSVWQTRIRSMQRFRQTMLAELREMERSSEG